MPGSADIVANRGLSTGGRIEISRTAWFFRVPTANRNLTAACEYRFRTWCFAPAPKDEGTIGRPLTSGASPSIYRTPGRVRAFGVGVRMTGHRWRGADDWAIKRRLGHAAAEASVPRLASWHARDGFDRRPLRGCPYRHARCVRTRRFREAYRGAQRRSLCLGRGRGRRSGKLRHGGALKAQDFSQACRGGAVTAQIRSSMPSPARRLASGPPLLLAGIAEGAEGLIIAHLARSIASGAAAPVISLAVVCRDGSRMATLARSLAFFAPDVDVLEFPAWDCLPYDRVSPHAAVVAQRMITLARLSRIKGRERPAVILTTVNALLQRVPPRETVARQSLSAAP